MANSIFFLRDMISKARPMRVHSRQTRWNQIALDSPSSSAQIWKERRRWIVFWKYDPLEKWESMKIMYSLLYRLAMKYLSSIDRRISISAERLFSKKGITMTQSRNQSAGKKLSCRSWIQWNQKYRFQWRTNDWNF